jgi:hypothetical protein
MQKISQDPACADLAPSDLSLTPYDQTHAVMYLRLPDAEADGADWREVAEIVLHINPARESQRARQAYESHLARTRWISESGYSLLLRDGWPTVN